MEEIGRNLKKNKIRSENPTKKKKQKEKVIVLTSNYYKRRAWFMFEVE